MHRSITSLVLRLPHVLVLHARLPAFLENMGTRLEYNIMVQHGRSAHLEVRGTSLAKHQLHITDIQIVNTSPTC